MLRGNSYFEDGPRSAIFVDRRTHLDTKRKSYARFWQISSSGFGDAIMVQIKDDHQRPYLSMDRIHIRAERTQLDNWGNNLGKFLKNRTSGLVGDVMRKSLLMDERMPDGLSMG